MKAFPGSRKRQILFNICHLFSVVEAGGVVRCCGDLAEHLGARLSLVEEAAVAVQLQEVAAVQDGQRCLRRRRRP